MVRNENLATFLRCIVEELNGAVRDELQTDHTRNVIDSVVTVLGRLIADAGPGREIAAARLDEWASIAARLDDLLPAGSGERNQQGESPHTESALAEPLAKLDNYTVAIQNQLFEPGVFDHLVSSLANGDAVAEQWLADTSCSLNDLLQNMENSFYRPGGRKGVLSVTDNLDLLLRNLSKYLCDRYPELPENPIETFKIVPGGQIKRTVILKLVDNDVLPLRLVLRQDMDMTYTGTTVTDEFVIIKRVFDLGLPVPEPILVEANPDCLGSGGCFMLMTEVEDALPAGTYFGEDRAFVGDNIGPELAREVAEAVASLHAQTLDLDPEAGRLAQQQQLEELQQVKQSWRSHTPGKPPFSLSVDLGLVWLEAYPLDEGRPLCHLHGDLGSHNMMSRDGHLAALIDWELAGMGDPARDLAQLKVMLLDFIIPWDEFKKAYLQAGGPAAACDEHAIAYFSIWAFVYHSNLAINLWERFNAGVRDDSAAANVASHSVERLALYEARALANTMQG